MHGLRKAIARRAIGGHAEAGPSPGTQEKGQFQDGLSIEKAFELLKKQANGELDAAELNSVSGGMKLGFTAKSGLARL